jgi:sec-independent protein translocase protein TatA
MFGLKMGELLIIFLVVLVLFGGTKLPQLGSSLGQAIRNFKKGFGGDADAQGEAQRQDTLSTGAPDPNKTGSRSPASAGKDV